METYRTPEPPTNEFDFETGPHRELREVVANPEAYRGCLVEVMLAANRGSVGARNEVESTVVDSCGRDLAMACGRCGITMVRDNDTVYGANKCPEVQSGQIALGELA